MLLTVDGVDLVEWMILLFTCEMKVDWIRYYKLKE